MQNGLRNCPNPEQVMASHMRTSRAGLDVIKAFEGFRPHYEKLPNSRWIIGYGHIREKREGVRVSETEAEAILREYDLPPYERLVQQCVLAPMNQNEFDALVSLAFNIGPKAFATSDVISELNAGNRLSAAEAIDHWRCAKISGRLQVIDALVRRRATEKALFLRAPGQMPAASSRMYRALSDKAELPAPVRPREILVERASASLPKPDVEDMPTPRDMTATEAAAESVRRQMVRILGHEAGPPAHTATEPVETDGASPEEITAAVSELAGAAEKEPVSKSVWPQHEDLPPPPHMEEAAYADEDPVEVGLAKIDDLEEVEVSQDEIQQAMARNAAMEADENGAKLMHAAPFGLLAFIGACLAVFGLARQFHWVGGEALIENGLAAYLPVFLIMTGGLLFAVMTYYVFRTYADSN